MLTLFRTSFHPSNSIVINLLILLFMILWFENLVAIFCEVNFFSDEAFVGVIRFNQVSSPRWVAIEGLLPETSLLLAIIFYFHSIPVMHIIHPPSYKAFEFAFLRAIHESGKIVQFSLVKLTF